MSLGVPEASLRKLGIAAVCVLVFGAVACGGQERTAGSQRGSGETTSAAAEKPAAPETTTVEKTTSETSKKEAELARAEIGPEEITNMTPADGKAPDPARPLPENPPRGIKVYPATTNRTMEGPIEYGRRPPTNGDHDPLWQNCGFYPEPVKDRHAVHSLDHGVVWITYRPNLPRSQVNTLRGYGDENYTIVSPYPGQSAPVITTSWRVQLKLEGANDPRLRQFVDEFRISRLAPLSGNRCVLGVGRPGRS